MPERCVDASVAIKWVVKSETWRKKARRFLLDSVQNGYTLIAPPLFAYEAVSPLCLLLSRLPDCPTAHCQTCLLFFLVA